VALVLSVLLLTLGSLLHGRTLRHRVKGASPARTRDMLTAARARGRLMAVLAGVLLIAWLVLFTAGVPPWAL
ncbi:MAG: hypothetical protein R3185_06755, partial [Candidatus Thermoplasmatota archaeon]|nr:hypothetical protein [Candidatus Thermoplasmatota archaeon]